MGFATELLRTGILGFSRLSKGIRRPEARVWVLRLRTGILGFSRLSKGIRRLEAQKQGLINAFFFFGGGSYLIIPKP